MNEDAFTPAKKNVMLSQPAGGGPSSDSAASPRQSRGIRGGEDGQPPGILGAAAVRVPGSCGELVQGLLDGGYFLVSCPVDFFTMVSVEIFAGEISDGSPGVNAPASCPKTAAAVKATLAHLGKNDVRVHVSVNNPIPRSKGLGSSTADVAAAIAATGIALGNELLPEDVARLAISVEPTDGVMFPGLALFDHREGKKMEVLGAPPPMELVALDFGGTVDTLEFNQTDRRQAWESVALEAEEALGLVRSGILNCDPALVGRGASISARSGQQVLPKPELPKVMDFAADVGAVGVNVAHSGTVIGVLLDARHRRGLSVYKQAQRTFPQAESVQHFRLLAGGIRRVDEKPRRASNIEEVKNG